MTSLGEDSGSWSLVSSGHHPRPTVLCILYAGINHSHEYDQAGLGAFLESRSLRVVLGTLTREAAADFLEREVAAWTWAVSLPSAVQRQSSRLLEQGSDPAGGQVGHVPGHMLLLQAF